MQRYILTERGKFLIAMLIMIVLFLISLLLIIWSLTRASAPEKSIDGSGDEPQSNISLSSSGPSTENPADSSQASPGGDNNGSLSPGSALAGPTAFDFDDGLMTFLFTPGSQTALDADTVSMIGELLKSPKNITGVTIAIEIPHLSDEDTAVMTTAIIDAFELHEIPLSSVVIFVYQPEPNIKTFAVNISFR